MAMMLLSVMSVPVKAARLSYLLMKVVTSTPWNDGAPGACGSGIAFGCLVIASASNLAISIVAGLQDAGAMVGFVVDGLIFVMMMGFDVPSCVSESLGILSLLVTRRIGSKTTFCSSYFRVIAEFIY
ncbi:hypothetical protein BDD12DRAFT_863273 [Trichophaea hybrida]|nr:hypothetical protein BDD12DRAFT_863273 [Trichophaea hybrida]